MFAGLAAVPAWSVPVENLYGATVRLEDSSSKSLDKGFEQALSQVLVKVTGLPDAARPEFRASRFPKPADLVQRYSKLSGDQLQVSFAAEAINGVLDASGLPVWGQNRPLTIVWLGIDTEIGRREILTEAPRTSIAQINSMDLLRERVVNAADERGLPLVLPLVDSRDLSVVTFADIWGGFRGPVLAGSKRYDAEVVLLGRSGSMSSDYERVRWTMYWGDEEQTWVGTAEDGPRRAAELLGQRLATFADAAGTLRVLVTNVASLRDYGELRAYFESLNIVEQAAVVRAGGSELEFALVVRGDLARLESTLDAAGFLSSVTYQANPMDVGRMPDLVYELVEQQ